MVESTERLELAAGRPAEVLVARSGFKRRLIYHWVEGSAGFGDELRRMLFALDRSHWRRDRQAVVVRVSTSLEGTDSEAREAARERIESFYRLLAPRLRDIDTRLSRKTFS